MDEWMGVIHPYRRAVARKPKEACDRRKKMPDDAAHPSSVRAAREPQEARREGSDYTRA
jgi:hypothetical protein